VVGKALLRHLGNPRRILGLESSGERVRAAREACKAGACLPVWVQQPSPREVRPRCVHAAALL
jgi:hypothetical protein